MTDDQELRIKALELAHDAAVKTVGMTGRSAETVTHAEAYYAFLSKKSDSPVIA